MAVPVRAELMAGLTEMGLRAGRAVRRAAEQRRERLTMAARLLPSPETLLAPQRQRADDMGERLGRGLRQRVTQAWRQLSDAGGALRPSLLRHRIERDHSRLTSVRLRPDLVADAIGRRRERLDAIWRLALSLDPRRPLAKGFALVTVGDTLVTSVDAARAAGSMRLTFHDGAVDVAVSDGVERSAGKGLSSSTSPGSRAARSGGSATRQQDLFSADQDREG
jgi:exodeoxyribonuclease VII large subunit